MADSVARCLQATAPLLLILGSAIALGADAEPSAQRCLGSKATHVGTAGADRIAGTARDDVIVAGAGNDVVRSRGGNDKVCGAGGNDRVVAGGGNDRVNGGGRDRVEGGAGKDNLGGAGGRDTVAGGGGNDRVSGQAGDDALRGNGGADRLTGGAGRDDCRGGPGADTILSCETGDVPAPLPGDTSPTAAGDAVTVAEDAGPQGVDVLANDTDPDGGPKSIGSVTQPANGSVTVTGGGTGLTYAPRADYCNSPGAGPTDDFAYTLAPGGSTAQVAVTVTCVNDSPTLSTTATPRVYNQGSPPRVIDPGLTAGDVDSANLSGATVRISAGFVDGEDELAFTDQLGITGTYDSGTGILTLTGDAPVADYQTALRSVTYENTSGTPTMTSRTVTFGATDTGAPPQTSAPASREVSVEGPNDPPVVDATDTALAHTENDPPTAVDAGLTVTDAQSDDITGGSASITSGFQAGQDALAWSDNDTGDDIVLDAASSAQTVVLTGADSAANYQAALRAVTYVNSSESPSTATRTVTFGATDEPGETGTDTRNIDVASVDDPPVANDDSATMDEDAPATAIPVLGNDTDVDAGPMTIASASDPANGTVLLTGGSPGAHTGLTYQPDPGYCNDAPLVSADTFTYTLNGGDTATVSVTVNCVNDAPVADDETFSGNNSAHGNTTLQVDDPDDDKAAPAHPHTEIAGDILAGDADVDGPGPLTVTPGTFATNDGGTVTLESDGDFVFQPAASTSCTDTSDFFDYTVEDSGAPEQSDTGRVTIAIAGCVWYVSNNAAGNSGTSAAPFDTLAQAETASGAGHTVFVFDGDNTSTGYGTGYALNSGERLIGEHEGLVVDPDQGGSLTADSLHPANAGAHPTLAASNEDVVALDDGNEVRGFNLDPGGTGGGIAGASGDTGGATIDDVNVNDAGTAGTEPGVELASTTGTFNFSDLTVSTNGATGIRLSNAGTANFASGGTISVTSAGAAGLDAASTNMGSGSVFDAITATASPSGGVSMVNTTGTTTFGDGSGTDLSLTTSSGGTGAFVLNTAGAVTVAEAGVDNVSATGGPAISIAGTSGGTFDFDDVSSTNSATEGVALSGLGTGTFSADSGPGTFVTNATGTAFSLSGGSGSISYPGNLNNGAGATASVGSRSGGVVTLSGQLNDTNDAGGGISLTSNTAGSTLFTNGTKTLNTGTSPAVSFTGSQNHTLTLSGGGLNIDTTSGKGLEAIGSGVGTRPTLNVTGSGNTIDTTTGRALEVVNMDVGATPLTFQQISTNGAASGIRLDSTGTNDALTVTGGSTVNACSNANSSGCTGGAILNSTGSTATGTNPDGTGIVLNSTRGVSLTRMRLTGNSNFGIRGNSVRNFTLANSVLNGTNGNADGEAPVRFTDLFGSASITATHVSGGFEHNFYVENGSGGIGSGNLDRITFSSVEFGANSTTNGDDGILLHSLSGAGAMKATVQGSTFTSSGGDQIDFVHGGAGQGDFVLTGSTFSNNHANIAAGGGGVRAVSDISAGDDVTTTITNNTFGGSRGDALLLAKTENANDMTGTVSGNTVNDADSSGIRLLNQGGGAAMTYSLTNNAIRGYENVAGIRLHANGTGAAQTGTLNATISGNLIESPGSGSAGVAKHALHVENGSSSGDAFNFCLDIENNDIADGGLDSNPASGLGIIDFRLNSRFNSSIRLPGYAGSATDTTAVTTFVQANNSVGGVPTGRVSRDSSSPGYTGSGTTCP